ncbi:MAG: FCD domain-containing protein [Xanthobacteraceae bacterium]|nr:FCD domain-containing protein [Xanthobacteraceae bacterium]
MELLSRYLEAGPGTRLPPERKLADELGLSRAEIRKLLARLEDEGRLSREVGRGTFVKPAYPETATDRGTLEKSTSPREAMEARLVIEPELASLAAINATHKQIEAMRALAKQMRNAKTWKAYEQLDVRLHLLIAEAAGNTLLVAVHEIVNEVRRAVVWKWLDTRPIGPAPDYSSFGEHDKIIDAIEKRDRTDALEAMRRHLRTTQSRLFGS